MSSSISQRVSLNLSPQLIEQIDNLARHEQTTRNGVIRMALLKYVRDPQTKFIANPSTIPVDKMYEAIKDDHPYLEPAYDEELIQILYQQKIGGQKLED